MASLIVQNDALSIIGLKQILKDHFNATTVSFDGTFVDLGFNWMNHQSFTGVVTFSIPWKGKDVPAVSLAK